MVIEMKPLYRKTMAAVVGLGALTLAALPAVAGGNHGASGQMAAAQQADGRGAMGPGYGMGPGMMGPGYGMGPGYDMGYGMGHGMTGPGYGMGPGMMGYGMMGPGQGAAGAGCPGYGAQATQDKDINADDVRARLERSLTWHGNKRLKVGEVKEIDDDTIVAEIVTVDNSLVQRFTVDRHTGLRKADK